MSNNDADMFRIERRRNLVARAMINGLSSNREIARYLEETDDIRVSHVTVGRDKEAVHKGMKERSGEDADVLREKAIAYLQETLDIMSPARAEGEEWALKETTRVRQEMSKLQGLYRPAKYAHTDPTGEREHGGTPISDQMKEIRERMLREGLKTRPEDEGEPRPEPLSDEETLAELERLEESGHEDTDGIPMRFKVQHMGWKDGKPPETEAS